MNLLHIFEVNGRTACIFQSPVVIPVKDHTHLCLICRSWYDIAQLFKLFPKLFYFAENSCIFRSCMCNNGAVELLTATHTAAELEELDRIRTVCHGLIALCPHLSRTLEGIVRLPVLLAWCLLHQHKRLILKATHQIMLHSNHTPRCIVCRIIIPGNHIHFLRPFEIIQSLKGSHHISCDRGLFVVSADRFFFHLKIIQHSIGIEPAVINGNSCKSGHMWFCRIFDSVTKRIWKHHFIPVINGMSPEFRIPCFIQFIQCLIFFAQPYPERFFTIFTITFSTVLIADMPAGHMWIIPVTLGKFACKTGCKFLKHR